MIETIRLDFESLLDIPQAVFAGSLGIEKHGKLIPTVEAFDVTVAGEVLNDCFKTMSGYKMHQLIHDCGRIRHWGILLGGLMLGRIQLYH